MFFAVLNLKILKETFPLSSKLKKIPLIHVKYRPLWRKFKNVIKLSTASKSPTCILNSRAETL